MEQRRRDTRDRVTATGSGVGRAIVIGPYRREPHERGHAREPARSPAARLDEAVGLARAIDLDVVDAGLAPLIDIAGLHESDQLRVAFLSRLSYDQMCWSSVARMQRSNQNRCRSMRLDLLFRFA